MDSKHRNQRNRRRERALRIQRQKLAAQVRGLGNGASGEEGDESPNRLKPQRPPNRRKRNKEPMFEEDIIDGFSILSFRSYEDLEIIQCNKDSFNQDSTLLSSKSEKSKKKSENVLNISRISPNKLNVDQNDSGVTSDDNFRFREEVNDSHSVTPIQLSDVSNHSTSGSGYMCDSESEEDKGSNSGSDLFTTVQRELSPTLRNKNVLPENSRLSPNFKYPLQNGLLGDEPMNSSPEPVLSSAAGLTSEAVCVSTPELPFLTNKVTINGSSVSATSELRENCPSPPCLSPIISGVLPNSESNFSISRTRSLNANSLSGGSKKNNGPVFSPTNPSKSLPILTTPVSHTSLQGKNAFPVINGVKTSVSSSDLSGLTALPKTSVPVSSSSFPFCISSSHTPQELPPPISTTALSRSAPLLSSTLVCSSHISHTPSTFVNSQPTSSVSQNCFPNHHLSLNPSLTTHSKTSTLTGSRDSHSNSSVSSLSQLSHSLHSNNNKESASSRGNTPALSVSSAAALGGHDTGVSNNTTSCAYTVASYGSTSLVFTKSHSWGRSNASPIRGSNGPTLTRSGGSSASIPLPPSLSTNHHPSPFGNLPGHPTLHPVIFGPASLAASGSPGGPSTYVSGDGIYPQPNADFLRRELDTRFLVSHDRTLGIHPPPFLRPEHHHHHQHSPFLPPHLGSPLLSPQPPPGHLYDKFPKLDSPVYTRNPLGLPGYSGATPFVPPRHLTSFQTKMNPLLKTKNMKSGRWCAMHVRIAWEIYHHQQKQQSELHKASTTPDDLLQRPRDFHMSLLLNTPGPPNGRPPFEGSSHPNSFLNSSAAHLSLPPFARPPYPSFGGPSSTFGRISSLGLGSANVFNGCDSSALSSLSLPPQDPWAHIPRNPHSISIPLGSGGIPNPAPWGGLKVERDKERKTEHEKEIREVSEKCRGQDREKRKYHRQKERDRENRTFHQTNSLDGIQNGEVGERTREWDHRERSRSPIHHQRESSVLENTESRVKHPKPQEDLRCTPGAPTSTSLPGVSDHSRIRSIESVKSDKFMMKSIVSSLSHPQPIECVGITNCESNQLLSSVPSSTGNHRDTFDFTLPRDSDREDVLQRYSALNSVMFHNRVRDFSSSSGHFLQDHAKVAPPPLRPSESCFSSPSGLPSSANKQGTYCPSTTFLNNIPPGRNKVDFPVNYVSANPPPLIPCSNAPSTTSSLHHHSQSASLQVSSKLGLNSIKPLFNKEKQTLTPFFTTISSQPR